MQLPIVHGFPVVDENKQLLGLVSREALMVVIGSKCWIEVDANSKEEVIMAKYSKGIAALENKFSGSNAGAQKPLGFIPKTKENMGTIVEENDDQENPTSSLLQKEN